MAEEAAKNKTRRNSMTLGRILSRISGKSNATSPPEVPHLSMPEQIKSDQQDTVEDDEDEEDTGSSSSSLSAERKMTRRGSWTSVLSPGKSPKGPTAPEGPMVLSLNPANPVACIRNEDGAIVKKVANRLRRGASSMDGQGAVYIYRKYDEAGFPIYRKITCVPKPTEQYRDLTLVLRLRCKRPRHAQVLIHLLADRVRVKRYYMNTEGTMLTVNRRTGVFVQDAAYVKDEKANVMGKRYSENWFMADETALLQVASSVVQDVNNHWISEPWAETL